MKKEKVLFRHVRTVDQNEMMLNILCGRVYSSIYDIPQKKTGTICLVINDTEIRVGMALCNPNDNFSRVVGRELSYERALKNPFEINKEFFGCDEETLFRGAIKLLNSYEKDVASNFRKYQLMLND